jgi:hypothetical protein
LEDEGRHARKGRGGSTQAGSVDLMDQPNLYGIRWASLWLVGSSTGHSLRARCPAGFEVGGSRNS